MKTVLIILLVILALPVVFGLLVSAFFYYVKPIGKPINKDISGSYFHGSWRNSEDIIFSTNGFWFQTGHEVLDVDKASFQVLDNFFAKDKNKALYMGSDINVDVDSFYVDNGIPKDANHVYVIGKSGLDLTQQILEDADPETFQHIDYPSLWGRDKNSMFSYRKKLPIDRDSFEVVTHNWIKDKDHVYRVDNDEIHIVNIDPTAIAEVNTDYVRDNTKVYFIDYDRELEKTVILDFPYAPKSKIEFLSANHIKHNEKVYYDALEIPNVDISTFVTLAEQRDYASPYSKDKNNVYYQNKIFDGADSASFQLGDKGRYFDKHRQYTPFGEVITGP